MRKKQLGAAREQDPVAEERERWFLRLRALPGFRTAAVAFLLTVVLGIGSTVAYAYWSQSTKVSITGTTAYLLPPVAGPPDCTARVGANRLSWTPVAQGSADTNAVYLLRFQRADNQRSVILAVPFPSPGGNPEVYPYNEHDVYEGLGSSSGSSLNVTVSTAVLSSKTTPTTPIRRVTGTDILQESELSAPRTLRYMAGITWVTAVYGCA